MSIMRLTSGAFFAPATGNDISLRLLLINVGAEAAAARFAVVRIEADGTKSVVHEGELEVQGAQGVTRDIAGVGGANWEVNLDLTSGSLLPALEVIERFLADGAQRIIIRLAAPQFVPRGSGTARLQPPGERSTGLFTVPDTPAGGPVFLRVFLSSFAAAAVTVPFVLLALEEDGTTRVVSSGQVEVGAGAARVLDFNEVRTTSLPAVAEVSVELEDERLVPSVNLIQRFIADGSTQVLQWIPPAQWSSGAAAPAKAGRLSPPAGRARIRRRLSVQGPQDDGGSKERTSKERTSRERVRTGAGRSSKEHARTGARGGSRERVPRGDSGGRPMVGGVHRGPVSRTHRSPARTPVRTPARGGYPHRRPRGRR